MISEKMVQLIKENADELTRKLCKELITREQTKSYRLMNPDLLHDRIFDIYSRLDSWLTGDKIKGEVRNHYTKLGKKRYEEGFPLNEVIMSLMLTKRRIWLYVVEKHLFDSSYEFQQALEFNNRIVLFFDRAIYFTSIGYEEELRKALPESPGGFFSRLFGKK